MALQLYLLAIELHLGTYTPEIDSPVIMKMN